MRLKYHIGEKVKYLATVKIENGRTVADYADGTVVWRIKDEEERSYIYGVENADGIIHKIRGRDLVKNED